MRIKAEQKNSRQTPRKVREVANQVKDKSIVRAMEQLALIERKAAIVLLKVMRQALANATNNHCLKIEDLEIDTILVKTGPTYKRYRAVSRGRGHGILKRSCHVEVILKTKSKETKKIDSKKNKK
ncbi:MAG: 50S ribosomal protein L22 [Patescibacteria group bacterium]|nr:50S ribosomal protein L22 [Patescibacteria group bacterium]